MPPSSDTVRIAVRVTPRGGRDAIEGWSEDANGQRILRVRVAAAPADGEANASVLRLLAKSLGLPASSVRIASGASSRVKTIEVRGAAPERLDAL